MRRESFLPLPSPNPNENCPPLIMAFVHGAGIHSLQFKITLLQRAIHGLTRLRSDSLSHSRALAPDRTGTSSTPPQPANGHPASQRWQRTAHSPQHSIFYRSCVGLRGVRPATYLGGPTVGAQRPGFWFGGGLNWAEVCVCVSSRSLLSVIGLYTGLLELACIPDLGAHGSRPADVQLTRGGNRTLPIPRCDVGGGASKRAGLQCVRGSGDQVG